MSYQIQPLESTQFEHLFRLAPAKLQELGIVRMQVTAQPGFPCRLSLKDAEPGDVVLLLNYSHLPKAGPYCSSHAIFISEAGRAAQWPAAGTVPLMLERRTLSIRAFDRQQMLLDARLCPGAEADACIREFLARPECDFVHLHHAVRGCYLAEARRK